MKQHAEIVYDEEKQNKEYEELIEKVINECFVNENMESLKLYISITLTNPKKIKELNSKYRNIDKETDVLSFPMFEKEELKDLIKEKYDLDECIGDIVISVDRVKEQAIEYGHSFERELAYMCVHGFYHLLGYDHMIDKDKILMRAKEDEVLDKLKITRN